MANTSVFDPSTFFEKTAYYASQGRGLFKLTRPRLGDRFNQEELRGNTFRTGTDALNSKAWDLLEEGIVAKSVTSPASSLATFEEFSYIGPTRKHPHTQIFGPLGVEFFLMGKTMDEARSLYSAFIAWQEYIAGPTLDKKEDMRSDSTFFAIEYYDNYVTEAEYQVFSPWGATSELTPVIHNKYYELYPRSVGQITTSWESPDAPLTLSVEFEFYYMQSKI